MIFLRLSCSGVRNRTQDFLHAVEVLYHWAILSDAIFEILKGRHNRFDRLNANCTTRQVIDTLNIYILTSENFQKQSILYMLFFSFVYQKSNDQFTKAT